jgi:hypothetical protein
MGSLTHITIDFETSHLVFPTLIGCVLLFLGAAIAFRERRALLGAGEYWREVIASTDKLRFFGTLALTVIYFSAMVPVGDIWPNTGMGFLLCSIPFVALIGLLFMHNRSTRRFVPVAIVALVAPTLVWWLFTDLFFLTLP